MPKRSPDAFARIAYQAYGDEVGWRNYQGLQMPAFDDLGERIQQAWAAACIAIVDDLLTPPGHSRVSVAATLADETETADVLE